jgi:hypothetical protein
MIRRSYRCAEGAHLMKSHDRPSALVITGADVRIRRVAGRLAHSWFA